MLLDFGLKPIVVERRGTQYVVLQPDSVDAVSADEVKRIIIISSGRLGRVEIQKTVAAELDQTSLKAGRILAFRRIDGGIAGLVAPRAEHPLLFPALLNPDSVERRFEGRIFLGE